MNRDQLINLRACYCNLRDSTLAQRIEAKEIAINNFINVLDTAIELIEPSPKDKHTIADNYPAGRLPEPCTYCLKASDKAEDIISKIDTAVGMITVSAEKDKMVYNARLLLIEASIEIGELFE